MFRQISTEADYGRMLTGKFAEFRVDSCLFQYFSTENDRKVGGLFRTKSNRKQSARRLSEPNETDSNQQKPVGIVAEINESYLCRNASGGWNIALGSHNLMTEDSVRRQQSSWAFPIKTQVLRGSCDD